MSYKTSSRLIIFTGIVLFLFACQDLQNRPGLFPPTSTSTFTPTPFPPTATQTRIQPSRTPKPTSTPNNEYRGWVEQLNTGTINLGTQPADQETLRPILILRVGNSNGGIGCSGNNDCFVLEFNPGLFECKLPEDDVKEGCFIRFGSDYEYLIRGTIGEKASINMFVEAPILIVTYIERLK